MSTGSTRTHTAGISQRCHGTDPHRSQARPSHAMRTWSTWRPTRSCPRCPTGRRRVEEAVAEAGAVVTADQLLVVVEAGATAPDQPPSCRPRRKNWHRPRRPPVTR